jgi:SOS-response transcriptional repressor LexA
MTQLSERQEAILDFLIGWQRSHAYCPSLRELQDALWISSISVVVYNLERLRERGLVEFEKGGPARTVRIAGTRFLTPDITTGGVIV